MGGDTEAHDQALKHTDIRLEYFLYAAWKYAPGNADNKPTRQRYLGMADTKKIGFYNIEIYQCRAID